MVRDDGTHARKKGTLPANNWDAANRSRRKAAQPP